MHTWPMGMHSSAVRKYLTQHWFHHVTVEVLCGITVLLSHQIDHVKSVSSVNNGQDEFLGNNLLSSLLKDIVAAYH
jgi:hypothetical protein